MVVGYLKSGWVPPSSINNEDKALIALVVVDIERSLIPASEHEVDFCLASLASVMVFGENSDAGSRASRNAFIEDLCDYPIDLIRDACVQWRRTETFFPIIKDLRSLIVGPYRVRQAELRRARTLRMVGDNPAPGGTVTAEWVRSVSGDIKSVRGGIKTLGSLADAARG